MTLKLVMMRFIGIVVPEITSGVATVTVGNAIYNVAIVDGKGTFNCL